MPFLTNQTGSDIPRHLSKKGGTLQYLSKFFGVSAEELEKIITEDRKLTEAQTLVLEKLLKSKWIEGKLKYEQLFGKSKKEREGKIWKLRRGIPPTKAVEKAKEIVAKSSKISKPPEPAPEVQKVKASDVEVFYKYNIQDTKEGTEINLYHVIPPHDKPLTLSGQITILK